MRKYLKNNNYYQQQEPTGLMDAPPADTTPTLSPPTHSKQPPRSIFSQISPQAPNSPIINNQNRLAVPEVPAASSILPLIENSPRAAGNVGGPAAGICAHSSGDLAIDLAEPNGLPVASIMQAVAEQQPDNLHNQISMTPMLIDDQHQSGMDCLYPLPPVQEVVFCNQHLAQEPNFYDKQAATIEAGHQLNGPQEHFCQLTKMGAGTAKEIQEKRTPVFQDQKTIQLSDGVPNEQSCNLTLLQVPQPFTILQTLSPPAELIHGMEHEGLQRQGQREENRRVDDQSKQIAQNLASHQVRDVLETNHQASMRTEEKEAQSNPLDHEVVEQVHSISDQAIRPIPPPSLAQQQQIQLNPIQQNEPQAEQQLNYGASTQGIAAITSQPMLMVEQQLLEHSLPEVQQEHHTQSRQENRKGDVQQCQLDGLANSNHKQELICFATESPELTDINQIRNLLLKYLPANLKELTLTLADEQLRQMYLEIRAQEQTKMANQNSQLREARVNNQCQTAQQLSAKDEQKKLSKGEGMLRQSTRVSSVAHSNEQKNKTEISSGNRLPQPEAQKGCKRARKRIVTTVVQQVQYCEDSDSETISKCALLQDGSLKRKPKSKAQMQSILNQICQLVRSLDLSTLAENSS